MKLKAIGENSLLFIMSVNVYPNSKYRVYNLRLTPAPIVPGGPSNVPWEGTLLSPIDVRLIEARGPPLS